MKPACIEIKPRPDGHQAILVGMDTLKRFDKRAHGHSYRKLRMIQLGVGIGDPLPVYGPVQKKPKPVNPWPAARRAALERDENRCRKCGAGDDLEVHHIKERVFGGKDEIDNLITLCGDCHCEWTFCQPALLDFEAWRKLPPSRYLLAFIARPWPSDISAATFKEHLLNAMALVMAERNQRR